MDWLDTLYRLAVLKGDDEEHRESHPNGWMRWRPYVIAIVLFFVFIVIPIFVSVMIEKR